MSTSDKISMLRNHRADLKSAVEKRGAVMAKYSQVYQRCQRYLERVIGEIRQKIATSIRMDRAVAADEMQEGLNAVKSYARSDAYTQPYAIRYGESQAEAEGRQANEESKVADALSRMVYNLIMHCFDEQRTMHCLGRDDSHPLFHLQEMEVASILKEYTTKSGYDLERVTKSAQEALRGDDVFDKEMWAIPRRGVLPVALAGVYEAIQIVAWTSLCRGWATRAVVQQDPETLEVIQRYPVRDGK